ncbi:hypothetical protein [Spartinivicinus ruber]|uniref:hypothetical protein n=1 Tax=Spartinivicinus ruber TaxID=2683272 RepID=UPI0013D6E588|nr:hypothetical protein [Spartinivicinus ruber]
MTAPYLEIDITQTATSQAGTELLTAKEIDKATNRALKKAAKWLRTHSLRELGTELSIRRTAIKGRVQIFPLGNRGMKVWFGLNRVGVHWLGQPRFSAQGVKVGRRAYPGAFIQPMRSGQLLVFKRKALARYAQGHDSKGRPRRHRLPIELVTENIETPLRDIAERWEARLIQRFHTLLDHEIEVLINGYA